MGGRKRLCWLPVLLAAIVLAVLDSFHSGHDQSVSLSAPAQSRFEDKSSLHIFDKTPRGRELLFSKTSTGDLWFRDANGLERCLASNVIRASFSPDGKKFAYGTSDNELFIETVDGQQLARLMRASDHVWFSNSAAVTFSAIVSPDYPELEQTVVYPLTSNQPPLPSNEK